MKIDKKSMKIDEKILTTMKINGNDKRINEIR